MVLAILIVTIIFGFISGYILGKIRFDNKPIGNLRIDESDPIDGPYLFLELESRPESFKHLDHVKLKVKAENYISQK